ncbi:MAG: hypothetical protein K2J47_07690 [Ruminococcus sp.]|nr:hypothetical protein [Ruminococcus sp.]
MTNAMETLYENYKGKLSYNIMIKVAYDVLKESDKLYEFADDLSEGVEFERKEAFNAGFKTAV